MKWRGQVKRNRTETTEATSDCGVLEYCERKGVSSDQCVLDRSVKQESVYDRAIHGAWVLEMVNGCQYPAFETDQQPDQTTVYL